MNKIDLRGVIVPSEYDASWAYQYIQRGIITPESYFRGMLNKADKGQPLTVYINSPGGSVFAANEMVNAVREWKAETKQPVNVVLGALTASAASAFAIMVADKIEAHSNAKMMFHGAWTMSIGGKELHADTAELLEKINGDIKTRLVSRYGMDPETVTQWFAEGREGWLSAQELFDAKMVSAILTDPSDAIAYSKEEIEDIEARGLGVAAFYPEPKQETETDAHAQNDGNANAGEGDQNGDAGTDNVPNANGEPEQAPSAEYQAGVAAGRAAEAAIYAERINALEDTARKLQSEKDKARAEILKLTSELADAKTDHENKLTALRDTAEAEARKTTSEHTAALADMQKKLAEAQAQCERLVSGGMTFCPDTGDKGRRAAADVDPRNRLHASLR